MSYLDKYPNCIGCPVSKYCGTMVSSIRLCLSYDSEAKSNVHALTLSKSSIDEEAEEQSTMWGNITD